MKSLFFNLILMQSLFIFQISISGRPAPYVKKDPSPTATGLLTIASIGLAHFLTQENPSGLYVCPATSDYTVSCQDSTVDQGRVFCSSLSSNEHRYFCVDERKNNRHARIWACTKPWMKVKEYNQKLRTDFDFKVKMRKVVCNDMQCANLKRPKNIFPVKNKKSQKKCAWRKCYGR